MNIKKNAAFTLIELLVVVLIIGILAAIAWPQYEMAVEKSRLMSVVALGRAVRDAQDRFYMANGRYTTSPEALDIEVVCPEMFKCDFSESQIYEKFNILPRKSSGYFLVFGYSTRGIGSDTNYCAAPRNNDRAVRVCQIFGEDFTPSDATWMRAKIE